MSFGVAAAIGCEDPQLFLGVQTHELRCNERVLLEDACVFVMGDGPMDVEVTRRRFSEGAAMPDDVVIERRVVDSCDARLLSPD